MSETAILTPDGVTLTPADGSHHVMLVGPVVGIVELDDGTSVNVTPDQVPVGNLSADQVEELAHKVAMHYYTNGHPDDIEQLEDGSYVQRPFNYEPPSRFAAELKGTKPKGTPHPAAKE